MSPSFALILILFLIHHIFYPQSLNNLFLLSSSFQGAAFGFHMIAAKAGEQLAPFLPQLVPRLYRYQFDPNLGIRQAMTSIWDALVTDKTLVGVDAFTPQKCTEIHTQV